MEHCKYHWQQLVGCGTLPHNSVRTRTWEAVRAFVCGASHVQNMTLDYRLVATGNNYYVNQFDCPSIFNPPTALIELLVHTTFHNPFPLQEAALRHLMMMMIVQSAFKEFGPLKGKDSSYQGLKIVWECRVMAPQNDLGQCDGNGGINYSN
eukprot:scaffold148804_cov19-Tisochrysis_lutea.AAC.1